MKWRYWGLWGLWVLCQEVFGAFAKKGVFVCRFTHHDSNQPSRSTVPPHRQKRERFTYTNVHNITSTTSTVIVNIKSI